MVHAPYFNTRHRLTQIIVLVLLILAGLLFSQVAKGQSISHKIRFFKSNYHVAVHKNSDMTCYILHKKRTSPPKHQLIATSRRSKSSKPLAETDEPARISSN